MSDAWRSRRSATYAAAGCGLLDQLDQRLRLEWLRKIGNAAGFQGGHMDGGVVVRGDVNDRQENTRCLETIAQFDPGLVIQVDIEDDATGRIEIVLASERFGG